MIENIFIGFIIVLAVGMGVWGWWIDNVGIKKKENLQAEQEEEQEHMEKRGKKSKKNKIEFRKDEEYAD